MLPHYLLTYLLTYPQRAACLRWLGRVSNGWSLGGARGDCSPNDPSLGVRGEGHPGTVMHATVPNPHKSWLSSPPQSEPPTFDPGRATFRSGGNHDPCGAVRRCRCLGAGAASVCQVRGLRSRCRPSPLRGLSVRRPATAPSWFGHTVVASGHAYRTHNRKFSCFATSHGWKTLLAEHALVNAHDCRSL